MFNKHRNPRKRKASGPQSASASVPPGVKSSESLHAAPTTTTTSRVMYPVHSTPSSVIGETNECVSSVTCGSTSSKHIHLTTSVGVFDSACSTGQCAAVQSSHTYAGPIFRNGVEIDSVPCIVTAISDTVSITDIASESQLESSKLSNLTMDGARSAHIHNSASSQADIPPPATEASADSSYLPEMSEEEDEQHSVRFIVSPSRQQTHVATPASSHIGSLARPTCASSNSSRMPDVNEEDQHSVASGAHIRQQTPVGIFPLSQIGSSIPATSASAVLASLRESTEQERVHVVRPTLASTQKATAVRTFATSRSGSVAVETSFSVDTSFLPEMRDVDDDQESVQSPASGCRQRTPVRTLDSSNLDSPAGVTPVPSDTSWLSAMSEEENDHHSGASPSSSPYVQSSQISRAPGGLYESYIAVSQKNRRRKRKHGCSQHVTARHQRRRLKSLYNDSREHVLNSKKTRYQDSPRFAKCLLESVKRKYKLSPNYRQLRLRRAANRYATSSPIRRQVKQAAIITQKKRRSSLLGREKDRACDKKRYHESSQRRQSVIKATATLIKQKYQTQSPFKRRIKEQARDCYWRIKSLMKRSDCNVKWARSDRVSKTPSSDQSSRIRPQYVNNKDRAENAYVHQLRGLMRKQSHLKSLLQRKLSRIRRHNAPHLPEVKKGTADHRRGAFTRWHRFKVNHIAGSALASENGGATVHLSRLQEIKTQASQLLDVILAWRRQRQSDLYATVGAVSRIVSRIDSECEDESAGEISAQLADLYCRSTFHVKYCESFDCDKASQTYEPASKLLRMEDVAVNEYTSVRLCDQECEIPERKSWALVLHTKLKSLNPQLRLPKLLHNITTLDQCAACNSVRGSCSGIGECRNVISVLLKLRLHYSYLRTVLREVYRVREIALELQLIELLLDSGNYGHYEAYKQLIESKNLQSADPEVAQEFQPSAPVSDADVLAKFGTLLAACKQGWVDNMQVNECCSCLRLVGENSIRRIPRNNDKVMGNLVLLDLVLYYERDRAVDLEEVALCFSCHRCLSGKNPSPPKFCYRNEIWPDTVPPQIKQLNPYELRLCSLATNCQHIVKLKPYNYRGPSSTLARGLKGVSVHLPLPQGSIQAVKDILSSDTTLPNMKNFAIYVDGLPNVQKKIIFRSLVDLTSVMSCLHWLKKNNVLYRSSSIVINDAFMLEPLNVFVNAEAVKCDEIVEDVFQSVTASTEPSEVAGDQTCVAENNPVTETDPSTGKGPRAKKRISFFDQPETVSAEGAQSRTSFSAEPSGTIISGREIADVVASMEFPINWPVPYPHVLKDHVVNPNTQLVHVPGHSTLEQYTVIDVEKSFPKEKDLEVFATKPIKAKPLSWNDPLLDVACFPHLFPYGRNGIFHERPQPVGVAMYLDNRLNLSTPRFRRDQTWVLNCALRKDMMAIDGGIHTVLNCGKFGKHVTAGLLKADIASVRETKELERCVNTLLGNIVGSSSYFYGLQRDVEAVIEDKGPATFFVTFSCGEYKNEDFREFLILRNTDIPNVQRADIRHLISLDPVSVSLHFHTRFMVFWDTVIMNEEGPLGKVKYFYIRKEYQQRGAPHMHCLLWIDDAPQLEKDGSNADIVLEYIEQYITCSLPDSITSPVLHNLVQSCQVHRCTGSCTRKVMSKGKFVCNRCRYGFPRDVRDKGIVNNIQDVQASRVGGKKRLRLYDVQRTISEVYINDYNPALLFQWKSNMDIQYVGDQSLVLNYYINKYMCKTEMQKPSDVSTVIDSGLSSAAMMKKLGCLMLKSRQLGIFEASDKVNRLPMYRMNVMVKQSPFYMPNNDRRRLKTRTQLEGVPDDSLDIYSRNFAHDYYPKRPDDLERLSAHDVLTRYDYCTRPGPRQKQTPLYVEELNTCFVARKEPAVVKMYKPSKKNAQAVENVSFTLLALFKPFRSIDELLLDKEGNRFEKYLDAYNHWAEELAEMQEFATSRQRLASAVEWSDEVQRKAREELAKETEQVEDQQIQEACEAVALELDIELCEQSARLKSDLSQGHLDAEYRQLNEGQRNAFDIVKRAVDSSAAICTEGEFREAQRLFVSGVGGTGKSFLIRALRNYTEFNYSNDEGPAVLVAAPTGIAAMNIDGVTMHKLLKLPVQKSAMSTQQFCGLNANDAKLLKTVFRNVKLLILDEVSMISNLTLLYIHQRLVEVKQYNDRYGIAPFANMNVLLLGDLLQLPPVSANPVFTKTTRALIMKNMGVMGLDINLWHLFDFVELTENMRQRDDAFYAQMLDRIRLGNPTPEDFESLDSRLICKPDEFNDENIWIPRGVQKMLELKESEPEVMCLMATTAHVDQFNQLALDVLQLKTIKCVAEDAFDAGCKAKKRKSRKKLPPKKKGSKRKTADTGGLEEELLIAEGARVMLRRNMDPAKKLVNGSIGIIDRLEMDAVKNCVSVLHVKFYGVSGIVPITRVSVKYCIGNDLFVMRTQFPVTLAYAITVHKCQGLSLESAIADIGSSIFADGMTYVVLSRVKRLRSLYLLRFDPGWIKCDGRGVKAYDALRRRSGKPCGLTKYNTNPKMEKYGKRVTVSADAQKAQLNEQAQMHSMAANISKPVAKLRAVRKLPLKKVPAHGSADVGVDGDYLKLRNPDAHACFANASVQCLLRCVEARNRIISNATSSAITNCLAQLCLALVNKRRDALTLDALRQAFGNASQFSTARSMDCDPVEFLQCLLEKLPTEVSDLFNFGYTVHGSCPNPACRQTIVLESAVDCFVALAESVDHGNFSVKQLFPERFLRNATCCNCSTQNFRFPCKKAFFFDGSNRYMLLHVPIAEDFQRGEDATGPISKALLGFKEDGVRLFNVKWKLIAFIQVSGNWQSQAATQRGLHYVAFVHHRNTEWICLNDECHHLLAKRPPCRHAVLYVLERQIN